MNLLNAFKDIAGDQIASLVGKQLGLSSEASTSALGAILPSLMGGIMGKVQDEESASGLLDFLGNNNLGGGMLDNIGDLFGSAEKTSGLMDLGGTALQFLMGNKTNAMVNLLTKVTGMDGTKMGSMLKFAAPLLLSFIGKKAKSDNLGASGLLSLISSQKDHVKAAAPAGLFDTLGLGAIGNLVGDGIDAAKGLVGDGVGAATGLVGDGAGALKDTALGAVNLASKTGSAAAGAAVDAGAAAVNAGKSGISKLLPLLLLLGAALVAMFLWKSCGDDVKDAANTTMDKTAEMGKAVGSAAGDVASTTGEMVKDAGNAVGDAANKTGEMVKDAGTAVAGALTSFKLPNGKEISSKAGSIADNMMGYLSGKTKGDATTRFTFDGVNFASGSANLTTESSTQLDNLVAIMQAYGKAKIRLEGHTDNTGNAAKNKTLSGQRAMAVKAYLQSKGIASNRVATEGFGQEKPIASNDTKEGQKQNRRVDVYITSK